MHEFQSDLDGVTESLADTKEKLVHAENEFKSFKSQKCRTRVEQIKEDIRRLQAELPYEEMVAEVKHLKQHKARLTRLLRQEQTFSTH